MAYDALIGTGTDVPIERKRFARHGRLAPQFGAPVADQLRAACDGCGSHLMAVTRRDGTLSGTCPVCLGRQLTPVPGPPAAA